VCLNHFKAEFYFLVRGHFPQTANRVLRTLQRRECVLGRSGVFYPIVCLFGEFFEVILFYSREPQKLISQYYHSGDAVYNVPSIFNNRTVLPWSQARDGRLAIPKIFGIEEQFHPDRI